MGEQFSIRFDGPAVSDDHAIDASLFGASLVSLAELITESQTIVSPDGPRLRTRVRSTGPGSFEVFLEIAELWDAAKQFLTSQDAEAIKILLGLFGPAGLIGVLVWLDGRKPDRLEESDETATFHLDNSELTIERSVGQLYSSRKVRKNLSTFVSPVKKSEVNELAISIPAEVPVIITPDQRAAIEVPIDDELVTDQVVEMRLRIEAIVFRSNRCEFREPLIGRFWANIEDEIFMLRVRQGADSFKHGDVLVCNVRVEQWDEGDVEYRIKRTIISVIDHEADDTGEQLVLE